MDQLSRYVAAYVPDHTVGSIDEASEVSRHVQALKQGGGMVNAVRFVELSGGAASAAGAYHAGAAAECGDGDYHRSCRRCVSSPGPSG